MIFLFVISMILGLVYALSLLYVAMQWETMPAWERNKEKSAQTGFTVVIPFRNESNNIKALTKSLASLAYNKDLFEVIFVDDHSTDDSLKKLNEISFSFLSRVISLPKGAFGKKKALDFGISHSKFEWIVTTDADCFSGPDWLNALDSFIVHHQPVMVCGPVKIENSQTSLQNYESLEFAALVSTAAATLNAGIPTTCNGANLAYLKKIYHEVGSYDGNWLIPGGDDEFLMKKVFGRFGNKVKFIKSSESIVYTAACASYSELWNQRLRWATKIRKHTKKNGFLVQLFLFVFCGLLVLFFLSGLFNPFSFLQFLSLLFVKISADWLFFKACLPFYNKQIILKSLLQAQLYQIYFIISIGIFSFIKTYQWKGRKL